MRRSLLRLLLLMMLLVGCGEAETAVTPTPPFLPPTPLPPIGIQLATRARPTLGVPQLTPSPLPPPTAVPSPTPFIYTVEAGDTLFGISARYNTTPDEILQLNPDVQPSVLQVGTALLMPAPATAVAGETVSADGETTAPIQVAVSRVKSYPTPVGTLWLLGEVTNEGALPVENARVVIQLPDGETVTAWVTASVLLSGAKAPFAILLNRSPDSLNQPLTAVVEGNPVADLGNRYMDLSVEETAVVPDGDRLNLIGQLRNVGSETASQISLIATFYDGQGNVAGYQQIEMGGVLAPGGLIPFGFVVSPAGGEIVTYDLFAQGLTPTEE